MFLWKPDMQTKKNQTNKQIKQQIFKMSKLFCCIVVELKTSPG